MANNSKHRLPALLLGVMGAGLIGLILIAVLVGMVIKGLKGDGYLNFLDNTTMTETLAATSTLTGVPQESITPFVSSTPDNEAAHTLTNTPGNEITPGSISTPELADSAGPGKGDLISPMDEMVMLVVPAGEFVMGSHKIDHEQPAHMVYLDHFWIDQTEVTNAQYADFLNSGGNQQEEGVFWLDAEDEEVEINEIGGNWQATEGRENHPVIEVSWYGARAYCEWAGRRLPTEAEWEKAARGSDGRTYPWGEDIDNSLLNFDWELRDTTEVGSYPLGASPFGALDMAGNVWEWTADWYGSDYYNESPSENPQGPSSGELRVLRGGFWGNVEKHLLSTTNRHMDFPFESSYAYGFRCAVSE